MPMPKENIQEQALAVATGVNEVVITTPAEMESATELLSQLNSHADHIKNKKDEVMRPLLDAVAAERKRWKPAEDLLKQGVDHIRKQMSVFQTAEHKKAEAEKAKIAGRVGEGKGHIKMTTAAKKMSEVDTPDKKVAAASGSVSFKTDYEVTVVDVRLIPEKFLEVKIPAIRMAHKKGEVIDGVKIEEIQVPINRR